MKIGIIGLGIMGYHAALKLMEHPFDVHGYDPFPRAANRAVKAGVKLVVSPEALAAVSGCILLFTPGPKETEDVITGENGILNCVRAGLVVANMSTVDPDTNIRMAGLLAAKGVGLIDSPVLGRPVGVGTWAFPVGGDAKHIDVARPVLTVLGGSEDKIFYVGPLGSGNKLKLLSNMMFGAINACAAEIMALAHHLGVSQKTLVEVAIAGNAGALSNLYKEIGNRIVENRYHDPSFTVDLLIKDNYLCLEMARKANLPMVLGNAVDYLNRMASLNGLGAEDNASMWKAVSKVWGGKQ